MSAPAVLRVPAERPSWLTLTCPYRDELRTRLRLDIPVEFRRWDKDARVWWIHRDYQPLVTTLLRGLFSEAYLIDGATWTDLHTGQSWTQLDLFERDPSGK
jgi:hypothetical protein